MNLKGQAGLEEVIPLFEKIKDRGTINREFWSEADPVYGSERYLERESQFVAREKQEDEESHFPGM